MANNFIKNRNTFYQKMGLLSLFLLVCTCAHTSDSQPQKPDLSHPADDLSFTIAQLILTHPQPPQEELLKCFSDVDGLTEDVLNERSMMLARENLIKLIMQGNLFVYHWCFYQIMYDTDLHLAEEKLSFSEKSDLFLKRMGKMWAFARALMFVRHERLYFDYLQRRYIRVSKEIFGRNIDIISTPLDEKTYIKGVSAGSEFSIDATKEN